MVTEITTQTKEDDLWLTVKIKDQIYAIDSKYVQSIFQLLEKPTRVPNCSPCIAGIIQLRKNILTIINLRILLGLESFEEEREQFTRMLEQRKQDHIKWVKELVRSVGENEEFKLATDPHKCALGKWYDGYKTSNHAITFQLNKIDEPHRALHKTALDIFKCKENQDEQVGGLCIKEHLNKAAEEYMPKVVRLLEETVEVFKESHRDMCVAILYCGELKAFMVDEVSSVEKLTVISDASDIYKNGGNSIVSHIGQAKGQNDQILMLDIDKLMSSINQ